MIRRDKAGYFFGRTAEAQTLMLKEHELTGLTIVPIQACLNSRESPLLGRRPAKAVFAARPGV